MSLTIQPTDVFIKQAKRLAKKHKNLGQDLAELQDLLLSNPEEGTELSNNCYKIRLANSSNKTGKSGGFRVIYYYLMPNEHIYLLTIYSKSEQGKISPSRLLELIKNLCP